MDNLYHALIMAGSALLFVIGISVAILNYNRIREINDRILLNNEYYARTAENVQSSETYETPDTNTEDMQKVYYGSEIANMILSMYDNQDVFGDGSLPDISCDEIQAFGKTYRKDRSFPFELDFNSSDLWANGKQREYIIRDVTFTQDKIKIVFVAYNH